jgi:hypothetical protein
MQRKLIFAAFAALFLLQVAAGAMAAQTDGLNGLAVGKVKVWNGLAVGKIKAIEGVGIATSAPSLTCTLLSGNTSYSTSSEFFYYNLQQYEGLIWDDGNYGQICVFKFYFANIGAGTLTGKDFYAEVWLLGTNSELATLVGRSDKVDGQNWSATLVAFSFSTTAPYDCTGANQYGIIVKSVANGAAADAAGVYDQANWARTYYYNTINSMSGCVARAKWSSGSGRPLSQSYTSQMPYAEVWTNQ